MKKLDNGDKMIIASVILAIGIAISAYFIANPKSELEKCIDTFHETYTHNMEIKEVRAMTYCSGMIRGK